MPTRRMDEIEKLLKNGRPAPQPEHSFQIIFQEEPKLIDVKQLERDAKEYQKRTGEADTSEMNKLKNKLI
jgi:hypothetical protein